jgi:Bacterial transcriptional regulator
VAIQAAEKLWIRGEIGGKHTSGAKAHIDYIALTPGINPRPTPKQSFSAVDHEEFHEGLQCLAVPVEGLGGRFVLGISVPKQRFDENFERYLAALLNAAKING